MRRLPVRHELQDLRTRADARSFGYAGVASKTPVQLDALFRIASASRPITSALRETPVHSLPPASYALLARAPSAGSINEFEHLAQYAAARVLIVWSKIAEHHKPIISASVLQHPSIHR